MILSPSAIMRRAWHLFREEYGFGRISGIRFDRAAFAFYLRKAWSDARKAAAILAMTADQRAERIADLQADLTWESMSDSRTALPRMAAITAELALYRAPALHA